jgi:hypothetical protein
MSSQWNIVDGCVVSSDVVHGNLRSPRTPNASWRWQCNAKTCRSYHTWLINWMNNFCVFVGLSHIFLLGILIFKRLNAWCLYKLFSVKGLITHFLSVEIGNKIIYVLEVAVWYRKHFWSCPYEIMNWKFVERNVHILFFLVPSVVCLLSHHNTSAMFISDSCALR